MCDNKVSQNRDIIIVPVDEDHFQTTVSVAVSSHFLGWIMSLDGDIKVVGPGSVVEQMRSVIKRLPEQYQQVRDGQN